MHKKLLIDAALRSGCVCPGDNLTYECTVVGGVNEFTYWTGTVLAIDCLYHTEIFLLHSSFTSLNETYQVCNNVVLHSLSVEGNNYTSQLNVTVTSDTIGKTIMCSYNNRVNTTIQFSTVIPTTGLSVL